MNPHHHHHHIGGPVAPGREQRRLPPACTLLPPPYSNEGPADAFMNRTTHNNQQPITAHRNNQPLPICTSYQQQQHNQSATAPLDAWWRNATLKSPVNTSLQPHNTVSCSSATQDQLTQQTTLPLTSSSVPLRHDKSSENCQFDKSLPHFHTLNKHGDSYTKKALEMFAGAGAPPPPVPVPAPVPMPPVPPVPAPVPMPPVPPVRHRRTMYGNQVPRKTPAITTPAPISVSILSNERLGDSADQVRERLENLRNNVKMEAPPCDCVSNDEFGADRSPVYTHLGSASSLPAMRKTLEQRLGLTGEAIRIEKLLYTGKEGKTSQGCPIAKWIIRRSGPAEKVLLLVKHRDGHVCSSAWIVVVSVAWEGVASDTADDLYQTLVYKLTNFGLPTERRCGTNDQRTCACQGVNQYSGASFSFGCSWSMYYNGCKFARSKTARKFRLSADSEEPEVEEKMQALATNLAPVYLNMAPDSYNNQIAFEELGQECRLGLKPGRPWSGVTACVDFCAHSHKDVHNMNNGCTVIVTLTKHRGFQKPDDEQLHVLPLYILADTDEFGSREGQQRQVQKGGLQILHNYPMDLRFRTNPLLSCRKRRALKRKNDKEARGGGGNRRGGCRMSPRDDAAVQPPEKVNGKKVKRPLFFGDSPIVCNGSGRMKLIGGSRDAAHSAYRKMKSDLVNKLMGKAETGKWKPEVANGASPLDLLSEAAAIKCGEDGGGGLVGRINNQMKSLIAAPNADRLWPNSNHVTPATPSGPQPADTSKYLVRDQQPFAASQLSPFQPGNEGSPVRGFGPGGPVGQMGREMGSKSNCAQTDVSPGYNMQSGGYGSRPGEPGRQVGHDSGKNINDAQIHPSSVYNVQSDGYGSRPVGPGEPGRQVGSIGHDAQIHPSPVCNVQSDGFGSPPVGPGEPGRQVGQQMGTNSNDAQFHLSPIGNWPSDNFGLRPVVQEMGGRSNDAQIHSVSPFFNPHVSPNAGFGSRPVALGSQLVNSPSGRFCAQMGQEVGRHGNDHPIHPVSPNDRFGMRPGGPVGHEVGQANNYAPIHSSPSFNVPISPNARMGSRPGGPVRPEMGKTSNNAYTHTSPSFNPHISPNERFGPQPVGPVRQDTGSANCNTLYHFSQSFNIPISPNDRTGSRPGGPVRQDIATSTNDSPHQSPYPFIAPILLNDRSGSRPVGLENNRTSNAAPIHTSPSFNPPISPNDGSQPVGPVRPEVARKTDPLLAYLPFLRDATKALDFSMKHEAIDSYDTTPPESPNKETGHEFYEVHSDNEENFVDGEIGGVAIALSHGSVLFECAKHELHASTALKEPNRLQPSRVALVFYQHKNMNFRNHGEHEYEMKKEQKRMGAATEAGDRLSPSEKKDAIVQMAAAVVPVRHATTSTTTSVVTVFPFAPLIVTGPYQKWIEPS